MYFADLTPCPYNGVREKNGLSVGWLDKLHDFPRGPVPAEFVERLTEICKNPVVHHLGFHFCELCNFARDSSLEGARSSTVIQVVARGGTIYFAPAMICHYVSQHGYQPPEDFIEAVMEND